jgi:hypothetical protein
MAVSWAIYPRVIALAVECSDARLMRLDLPQRRLVLRKGGVALAKGVDSKGRGGGPGCIRVQREG